VTRAKTPAAWAARAESGAGDAKAEWKA
jgi:hypothetical protein